MPRRLPPPICDPKSIDLPEIIGIGAAPATPMPPPMEPVASKPKISSSEDTTSELNEGGNPEKARESYTNALRRLVDANADRLAEAAVKMAIGGNAVMAKEINARILDASYGTDSGDIDLELLSETERAEFRRLLAIARSKSRNPQS